MSHAEENAVSQAARIGARLKGCTAYVTHAPCARCARALIQAGIERVVVVGSGRAGIGGKLRAGLCFRRRDRRRRFFPEKTEHLGVSRIKPIL